MVTSPLLHTLQQSLLLNATQVAGVWLLAQDKATVFTISFLTALNVTLKSISTWKQI